MNVYELLADVTSRLLAAAADVREALTSGNDEDLRKAIVIYGQEWHATEISLPDPETTDAFKVLIARAGGRATSSITSNYDYCHELWQILGLPLELNAHRESASRYLARLFAGNTRSWQPAEPENRKLITELPECEAALLEAGPDDVDEGIARLRGDRGREWRKEADRDALLERTRMFDEATITEVGLGHVNRGELLANRADARPEADSYSTLTKKQLRNVLGIKETELRNRVRLGEIKFMGDPAPTAKTVMVDLRQFDEETKSKLKTEAARK